MKRARIAVVVGTRPEVIKMAPVVAELKARQQTFEPLLVSTAQHREMLDQALDLFGLEPDVDLALMQENQTLGEFASRALGELSELFGSLAPDAVLIQGDTTTVMTAALAAFYRGIPVGHVEAGLRSFDRRNPFPEELNRKVAGCLADFHFAPTEGARRNLRLEGVADDAIVVTGNTIVDALESVETEGPFLDPSLENVDFGRRVVLVTAHRRESHGRPLRSICRALNDLVRRVDDLEVVYPVHLNPNVRRTVTAELGDIDRIHLVEPLAYIDLLKLMRASTLVLTDSGGIQEECPSFRKPVLVLRDVTERPELIASGLGKLVGTRSRTIVEETLLLLNDAGAYARMSGGPNPFGDGRAAARIVGTLERRLQSARVRRADARTSAGVEIVGA